MFFNDIVPDPLIIRRFADIFQVLVLAPTLTAFTASSVLPVVKLVLHLSETYLQLSHECNCNLVIYVHYQCLLVKKMASSLNMV